MRITVAQQAPVASATVTRARASVSIVVPVLEPSAVLLAASTTSVLAQATAAVETPVSSNSYILLASSSVLDTSGLYSYKADISVVTDTSFRIVGKTLTSTFESTDYITDKAFALGKNDSVSTPDFVIRTLEFLRNFTDTFGFTHNVSFTFDRPLADSFSLADSAAKGFTKQRTDTFGVSDTAPVFLYQLAYTDSAILQETINRAFGKTLADSAGTNDAAQFNLGKHSFDSFYLAETLARGVDKPLSDSFTNSDSAARDTTKSLVDSFPLSDFAVRNTLKVFSDSFGSSETLTRAIDKGVFDTLVLSDYSSRIIGRVINDGVAMNDSADFADNITYQTVKYVTNLVFVADTSTRAWSANKADSVSLVSSGILTSQNYCDLSYFAEDYVGSSRTFS